MVGVMSSVPVAIIYRRHWTLQTSLIPRDTRDCRIVSHPSSFPAEAAVEVERVAHLKQALIDAHLHSSCTVSSETVSNPGRQFILLRNLISGRQDKRKSCVEMQAEEATVFQQSVGLPASLGTCSDLAQRTIWLLMR